MHLWDVHVFCHCVQKIKQLITKELREVRHGLGRANMTKFVMRPTQVATLQDAAVIMAGDQSVWVFYVGRISALELPAC